MLSALSGARYFSSLDAASGYWQLPVEASAIPKTAFICTEGLFEFLAMLFGLYNAAATYQRMMRRILGDLLWKCCLVYILVFGSTFEEHNRNLREVLRRIREHDLLLKVATS
ncbi:KRAB-A domain protein [Gregarina niphandrodes]|uniref:KRAB-A domain protein n=1 Tax=Gregarina niphandrodes TaxID=110365 RepID=A0A023AV17_GRENI|nr:KRAB-A domain protein [Gregarina niphandrodes]EZG42624.1 KRAB-A domain protein [Gregarina niphandrodes]|eukprot:XP_011134788.1 KRAB-A domain protein [Gregarina niphandrodes]